MGTKDARIDAYIAKSQPFAQPILRKLRALVHKAVPGVEETVKWGMPYFGYAGDPICGMAAFKQHAVLGFWKAALMKDAPKLGRQGEEAMGHMGRLTSLKDLPSDAKLIGWFKEAAKLNQAGTKVKRAAPAAKKPVKVPPFVSKALRTNSKARATWEAFSPSHRREYVEWITEAKSAETRERRMATALEWLAAGKSRNWKYER